MNAVLKTAAALAWLLLPNIPASAAEPAGRDPGRANPVLPGYYADPSVVRHDGRFSSTRPWIHGAVKRSAAGNRPISNTGPIEP